MRFCGKSKLLKKTPVGAASDSAELVAGSRELKRSRLESRSHKSHTACSFQLAGLTK